MKIIICKSKKLWALVSIHKPHHNSQDNIYCSFKSMIDNHKKYVEYLKILMVFVTQRGCSVKNSLFIIDNMFVFWKRF